VVNLLTTASDAGSRNLVTEKTGLRGAGTIGPWEPGRLHSTRPFAASTIAVMGSVDGAEARG